jgi:hypothetical protein
MSSEADPRAKIGSGLGRLKYGNPSGDFRLAPRCGAKNRAGKPCRCPTMGNGRCHLHGGKSTGPRTPEGKARIAAAQLRHGRRTARATAERKANARIRRRLKVLRFLAGLEL